MLEAFYLSQELQESILKQILKTFDVMATNMQTTISTPENLCFGIFLCEKFLYDFMKFFRSFWAFANKGFLLSQNFLYFPHS